MTRKGMLLVLMQPPAQLEEEYNDWYDTEHLIDRMSAPGFETGRRYVSASGGPRTYIVVYDLTDAHVLDSSEYKKLSGDSFTPWTKRLMRRIPRYRALTEQVYPGDQVSVRCGHLLLLRFAGLAKEDEAAVIAGAERHFGGQPQTAQWRVFTEEVNGALDYIVLVGSYSPVENQLTAEGFGARVAGSLELSIGFIPHKIGKTWEKSI